MNDDDGADVSMLRMGVGGGGGLTVGGRGGATVGRPGRKSQKGVNVEFINIKKKQIVKTVPVGLELLSDSCELNMFGAPRNVPI